MTPRFYATKILPVRCLAAAVCSYMIPCVLAGGRACGSGRAQTRPLCRALPSSAGRPVHGADPPLWQPGLPLPHCRLYPNAQGWAGCCGVGSGLWMWREVLSPIGWAGGQSAVRCRCARRPPAHPPHCCRCRRYPTHHPQAFTPIITMLALFVARLETPSRRLVASVSFIALGTALASAGEVRPCVGRSVPLRRRRAATCPHPTAVTRAARRVRASPCRRHRRPAREGGAPTFLTPTYPAVPFSR